MRPGCKQARIDAFVSRESKLPRMESDGRLTVVELFAGAGGMALGLEQAGFRHIALVERDAECVATLRANGFRSVLCCDAAIEDYSRFQGADLVAGGPPCQPFSIEGKSEGRHDARDGWSAAIRAVREVKPRAFVFENVMGMMRDQFEEYRNCILRDFYDMGYCVHMHVVDAAHYGVAQHRKRLFMTGFRGVHWFAKPTPEENQVTVQQALQTLGPPNGVNGHELHGALARPYGTKTGSSLDKPSRTLVAGSGHPGGGTNMLRQSDGFHRYYTLREMARLQSFPDTFKVHKTWSRAMHQMGNACPPKLARVFGQSIHAVLSDDGALASDVHR